MIAKAKTRIKELKTNSNDIAIKFKSNALVFQAGTAENVSLS